MRDGCGFWGESKWRPLRRVAGGRRNRRRRRFRPGFPRTAEAGRDTAPVPGKMKLRIDKTDTRGRAGSAMNFTRRDARSLADFDGKENTLPIGIK